MNPTALHDLHVKRRDARTARAFEDRRRAETSALLSSVAARAAIALHGTPVLLLDPERVRRQYRHLRRTLPFVGFHYAVKALAHDAVLDVLDDAGCGFDIAGGEELALLTRRGVDPARIIHTHPIKKPAEIAAALAAGVRTFVVDNDVEIDKFRGAPPDTRLLVRLAYRSPHAKSDLSSKFGVGPFEAAHLVERALAAGVTVAGFSYHVGSQLDDAGRFAAAAADTLELMDILERRLNVQFDTLDIGGGFPASYDAEAAGVDEMAAALRPVLEPHARRLDIIAEPGRVMVADAMTLVTSVVGIAERSDGRWYYLDDGLYGSYSNVLTEDVHPLVFAERDLPGSAASHPAGAAGHRWATLAGPTCDSSDVIAREVMLPDLRVGDLLVSPTMGAYTTVTATRFNGRPFTPVAVLGRGPVTGEIAVASDARRLPIV
ncbi:type III PLP-dependent enzyme [Microbacterium sp. M3]|uniref:ornithine decarboxylase n=1 Tax=Microbacterium arthrosphaerae TaxID=792652 RepID=A0ABU4GXM6_9MICO|nr:MULTISPECIES: type III PLP-dependent enzyme [Microbacterium]MDW4571838.1 type III PLP-dependent enzyme [Microbacterium arthrosphaerae]MDW7605693.1 type III PLP-dependent enzyme [Microbacterium sp. M3]